MGRGIHEDGHLLVLTGHVHDAVFDDVHEGKGAADPCGGHVPDRHRDVLPAGFGTELLRHRLGQLDPLACHALFPQWDGNSPGADAELERPAPLRQVREQPTSGSRTENADAAA